MSSLQEYELDGIRFKTGQLIKQGRIVKNWKVRTCVLDRDGKTLKYFEAEKNGQYLLKGRIQLEGYVVADAEQVIQRPNSFMLAKPGNRTYFFVAENSESKDDWVHQIRAILKVDGKNQDLVQIGAGNPRMEEKETLADFPKPVANPLTRLIPVSWEEMKRLRDFGKADLEIKMNYEQMISSGKLGVETIINWTPYLAFFVRKQAILNMNRFVNWEEMKPEDFFVSPINSEFLNDDQFMFFSHLWHSKEHPDPEGADLQFLKGHLANDPAIYVWIDYCCLPQNRKTWSKEEAEYALKSLGKIPLLIMDCCFNWWYDINDQRNRGWIFYEIFMNWLVHKQNFVITDDNKKYYRLILQFLESHDSIEHFLAEQKFVTTSKTDLTYIERSLSFMLKLRSAFMNVDPLPLVLHYMFLNRIDNLTGKFVFKAGSTPFEVDFSTAEVLLGTNRIPAVINHSRIKTLLVKPVAEADPLFFTSENPQALVPPDDVISFFAQGLVEIKKPLDEGIGQERCKRIGKTIYQHLGNAGMMAVCEYVRDVLHNKSHCRSIERAWDGIGQWMGMG